MRRRSGGRGKKKENGREGGMRNLRMRIGVVGSATPVQ